MKNEIIKIASKQKISDVGFCSVENYNEAIKFVTRTAILSKERKSPQEVVEGAKTIVVCAFNYFNGLPKGNLSRYATGADYHKVVTEKMLPIAEFLKNNGFQAEVFADTGFLNERILAKESGIAFFGRNNMAISSKFGSYFFIGYVLTDCEIEADARNENTCQNCGACEKACPLNALVQFFNEERCLSYITQKKGELTESEKKAMIENNLLWGCDICQEVCPHNKDIPITQISEFCENVIIDFDEDFEISNKKFSKKYKNRAFAWRGKGVIIRNLKILKKN